MKPKNDRKKSDAPAPRKRFCIQKLEARIAPGGPWGHYNRRTMCVGPGPCDLG